MYSIRRRLTIWIAGTFVVLVAGAGLLMARTIERRMTEEFDTVLVAQARALKSLTEEEAGQIEFDYVPDYMPEYEREEAPDYFQFWLDDGRVLLRSNRLEEDLPHLPDLLPGPRVREHRLGGGRLVRQVQIAWRPKGPADGRGDDDDGLDPALVGEASGVRGLVLVVARGRERLDGLVAGMQFAIFTLGGLASLLAVLLVWRILASGFRPIESIAAQVETLDADTLGSRVGLPVTPRELAPVVEQLNALLERLGASFEWERRFAGNVAHELRTPIAELRSLASVGSRWPEDEASVRLFFEDVGQVAGRMEGLVADLLLLARCQAGVEGVTSEPTEVREVIEQAWSQLAPSAQVAGHRFRLEAPADLVIYSDPVKLGIVFANLLGNAVSYAPADTEVCCVARIHGDRFSVEMENAAEPLPPGSLASLTEAFWRGDDGALVRGPRGAGALAGGGPGPAAGAGGPVPSGRGRHLPGPPGGRSSGRYAPAERPGHGERAGRQGRPKLLLRFGGLGWRGFEREKCPMSIRCAVSALLVLLLGTAAGGCGGGSTDALPQVLNAANYVEGVNHQYFPLTPGVLRVYEGTFEGEPRQESVHSSRETREIAGIPCTSMTQEVFVGGVLTEMTTEWYAEDREGNVWKFGEESFEAVGPEMVPTADSWMVGVDTPEPWRAFPAEPRVGEVFQGFRPDGIDTFQVLSITDEVAVPAGPFHGCLKLLENPEDPEDTDIILYAPGVGRVVEDNAAGRMELTAIRTY